jgi:hypothetical protein
VSASLRLRREAARIELRRGQFEILIDGKNVGSLHGHATVEVPVEPGHSTLRIRTGRHFSHNYSFDATDDKGLLT